MRRSLTKKARKVIEAGLEEMRQAPLLAEITGIGARMMLQVAVVENKALMTIYRKDLAMSV
ncbi:MAG: hypothetical protein CVV37_07070 [Nitrospira bacterium HGW-Nitrospira-1]|nr:MAG: hypothetical protein CVV37_07070 [Nitrospira bacterium HGW-Nitrospira-1]